MWVMMISLLKVIQFPKISHLVGWAGISGIIFGIITEKNATWKPCRYLEQVQGYVSRVWLHIRIPTDKMEEDYLRIIR